MSALPHCKAAKPWESSSKRPRAGRGGAPGPCSLGVEAADCGRESDAARKVGTAWASHAARIGSPDYCFGFAVKLAMTCIDQATMRRRKASEAAAKTFGQGESGSIVPKQAPVEEYPTHWDLNYMRTCGAISDDDFRQLKYDLYTFEWEAMLKKGCISQDGFESLCGYFKKCKSAEELRALRRSGAISVGEFQRLMYDLDRLESEDLLKRGLISENDFHVLQGDLRKRNHTAELKIMRTCGAIPVEDNSASWKGMI